MTLLGKGVVAIWNGIAPGLEDAFLNWHVHEHMRDRVGLPGFQRGRRYVSIDGSPGFFNFYETESLADLTSEAYMAALNHPTPWTGRVIPHFTQMSRTLCRVVASSGRGAGAVIETVRLASRVARDAFIADMTANIIEPAVGRSAIVGAHLLEGQSAAQPVETAETRLRGAGEVADWIMLVEAARHQDIVALRRDLIGDDAIIACGAAPAIRRGAYGLQFALSRTDLEAAPRP
ncbi:hypothetical protein [Devosia sp. Root635]|uniref:hypothetical protein n=1 Tax=Devosia sp. Root635 TaxID=1736575 RepID=UPI0006F98682|nr:hypothetical protein [Devosia sp. Root635]KRA47640.1 hypothetical protein ASD80_02210 [Devosia sp. Root635]